MQAVDPNSFKLGMSTYQSSVEYKYNAADLLEVFQNTDESSLSASVKFLKENVKSQDELQAKRSEIITQASKNSSKTPEERRKDIEDLARDDEAFSTSQQIEARRLATNKSLAVRTNVAIPKTSFGMAMMEVGLSSIGGAMKRLVYGGKADKSQSLLKATRAKKGEDIFSKATRDLLATLASPLTYAGKVIHDRNTKAISTEKGAK